MFTTAASKLAEYFQVDKVRESAKSAEESFNVAPTNEVLAVAEHKDVRVLGVFRWGLVPYWAKDPSIGNRMINARAESLQKSNAYKKAFERRRCLITADGFYEWEKLPSGKKRPFFIRRPTGEPIAFAGLWERWRDPSVEDEDADDAFLRTCVIVTTDANSTLQRVHDRMPVVLLPEAWEMWLDPDNHDIEALQKLLVPAPDDYLEIYPVSTEVNNVRNNGPQLIELDDSAEGRG